MMRNLISNIVWGLLLIVVGVGYAGNTLNFWDFSLFFKGWWTLFIIIPCLLDLIQHRANGGNVLGLCIGVALLLSAQGLVDFAVIWKLMVPILLILVGISILFGNRTKRIKDQQGNRLNFEDVSAGSTDVSAVFGGRKARYNGQVFEGATVNAVFGGVEMDLRMAVIEHDVQIDVTAVFGGVDILVPSNVMVKVVSTPVLGGVTNKAMAPTEVPCHTLYVNATCVFGGVDIK